MMSTYASWAAVSAASGVLRSSTDLCAMASITVSITVAVMAGSRSGRSSSACARSDRSISCVNDLITNVPHQPGVWGLLLRLTGSTGRPRVIPIVRRRLKIDRAVMHGYLEALARRRDVAIITTSHGQALTSDVAAVVGDVARDLDPSAARRHRLAHRAMPE
jgi:hypothetical protein